MVRAACLLTLISSLLLAACSGSSDDTPDARLTGADARLPDAASGPPTEFGGDRPVTLQVPTSYDADTPTPLVIALHGRFTNADYVVPLLAIADWYEEEGFLFAAPKGLEDPAAFFYWNGTDACCDLYDSGVDDSTYLADLIGDIAAEYNVDPKRVYLIGHSNGGFMAFRMACDHADLIAAVISFAGATFATTTDCTPSEPVSVVELHGTADDTILYDGGVLVQNSGASVAYPSAATTVATWAAYNGCDAQTEVGTNIDLTTAPDAETEVVRHTGCGTGVDAELWTIPSAGHITGFAPGSRAVWWAWFEAHAKP